MRSADVARKDEQRRLIVGAARTALVSDDVSTERALSRRVRWQVVARDLRADLAAVAVARRGKRAGLAIETHRFKRADRTWQWADIGAVWDSEDVALPERPSLDEGTVGVGSPVASSESEGIWTDLYHLPIEAERLREPERLEGVPLHGWVVRVRLGPRVPTDVLDADGQVLGRLGAFFWR